MNIMKQKNYNLVSGKPAQFSQDKIQKVVIFGNIKNQARQNNDKIFDYIYKLVNQETSRIGTVISLSQHYEDRENYSKINENINRITKLIPYIPITGFRNQLVRDNNQVREAFPTQPEFGKLYFSFNLGYVHYVLININEELFTKSDLDNILIWLQLDLEKANKQREKIPWIVIVTNQPLYSQSEVYYDVFNEEVEQFSDLFKRYKVDLHVSGGLSSYSRTYSVQLKKKKNYESSIDDIKIIKNPEGTIYITESNSGQTVRCGNDNPSYMAICDKNYGYGLVYASSKTELIYQHNYHSGNRIIDQIKIVKSPKQNDLTNDKKQSGLTWVYILIIVLGAAILLSIAYFLIVRRKKQLKKMEQEDTEYQTFN